MNRRQEIIDALLAMIKEGGLNVNFTMSELAEVVDIGKSTIYEYFSTKEDIVQAALSELFDKTLQAIYDAPFDDTLPFEVLFKKELQFMFELNDQKSYIMRYIQVEYEHTFPKFIEPQMIENMHKVRTFYEKRFTQIIQKGIEEAVIPEQLNDKTIFMIQSVVAGSIIRYTSVDIEHHLSLEDTIDAIYDALLRIVKK
ncbi:MAG: TetR/AcrR family transcriptional regulator [Candidatus Izimaplasma sp.]|nr:TetR/AcrR family transcriptional regulator [Candidatus Izimaplasma bacterium]